MYNGDEMPAHETGLAGPSGLACGGDGALYIADTFNNRIRAVDLKTGLIRTVVGDGGEYRYQSETEAPSMSLSRPYGIAITPNGDILITDSDNHLIRRWERRSGRIIRVAGSGTSRYSGDGGSPLETSLNYPFGVAVDASGNLFIADTFNHRIRLIAA
jgi:sugar lactone lactonase YvrE